MLYQLISKLLAKIEKIFHCYCYEVKAHRTIYSFKILTYHHLLCGGCGGDGRGRGGGSGSVLKSMYIHTYHKSSIFIWNFSCVFHASFVCPDTCKELMNDKNVKFFLENKGIDHEYT